MKTGCALPAGTRLYAMNGRLMYSPKIRDDLIPKIYQLGRATKKPMTQVVDTILRTYFYELDMSETGRGGESYSQDRIPDLVERDVRIEKRSDGRYSVAVFDPIKDDSLAYYLKRNYELWDFKIFNSRKEAEAYASLQKKMR